MSVYDSTAFTLLRMDITKLYTTQVSLTEWLEKISHEKTVHLRLEDNEKRERLKVLHELIGLPFDRPFQFDAADIVSRPPSFQEFLQSHGQELCALRLIPKDPTLPKLRMRGQTIQDSLLWFQEQAIDPTRYRADFVPHSDVNEWATIFVVNSAGIFGEIIRGGHHQLTQGFYEDQKPITFSFDWSEWRVDSSDGAVLDQLRTLERLIVVSDPTIQKTLSDRIGATFAHDHLVGYFETVITKEFGVWFIDYNRILGELYADFQITASSPAPSSERMLVGRSGSRGVTRGRAHIVLPVDLSMLPLSDDEILVCDMTTPEFLPLMSSARAVVTDRGGVLTHAAIVCRELKKPCVVGTGNATTFFKTGERIEVDGDRGVVISLEGLRNSQ